MLDAFKVQLSEYQDGDRTIRCRVGPIYIPAELKHIVTGVFGLDNRPQAHSHLRLANSNVELSKPDAFDGNQLASVYGFPSGDGQGQTIALIELGGGFLNSDIQNFFDALKLPRPQVNSASVNGGNNTPILDSGADMEVALDIEVAGAVAPKADIVIYFAPNNDASFLKAILAAVHDQINKPTYQSVGAVLKALGPGNKCLPCINASEQIHHFIVNIWHK
jgi:kumamolisin